ncbi:MAG: hypothetical protein LBH46_02735 [Rickettsiales bacterium]|jgi:hypothetical protein|nr:hypothetical protein [Rickettsiales bacterium]
MLKLLLVGLLLGIVNTLVLKLTIKKMTSMKKYYLFFVSFFCRMFFIGTVFYIFLDKSYLNAIFMLLGFSVAKFIFLLKEKTKH